jgi:hypothetical protein
MEQEKEEEKVESSEQVEPKRTAKDVSDAMLAVARTLGATHAIAVVSFDEKNEDGSVTNRFWAGFIGVGLAVRGLLETGLDALRDAIKRS